MNKHFPVRHSKLARFRTRPLTGQYAFVSYSTRNWDFVRNLVESLKNDGVWVDKWNIDIGDPLPSKIEEGIAHSAEFIFVLSKESLESNWARYESHMAVIRALEDANFRIIIIRIDKSQVPLRFRPFLYVDGSKDRNAAIEQVQKALKERREGISGALYRRQFVNRHEEIGQMELAVADPETSLVCLWGIYGMGKRTVVDEAIKRIWQKPATTKIQLSEAHFGSRLSLDLCAAAGIDLPPDGASRGELIKSSLLAVEILVSKGQILVFDRLETLLNDSGFLHPDFNTVIEHLSSLPACFKVPIFLLSRRMPKLKSEIARRLALVKLGGMLHEHVVSVLENEVNRIERRIPDHRASLVEIAKQLHGYPLAARLAAPLLVKHSSEFLLANLIHVTELRRDVAEAILSHTHFSATQLELLKVFSICDASLTVPDLSGVSGRSPEKVVIDIDRLADDNLLEPDGVAIRLHPLLVDFYWKQARSSPDFEATVGAIAKYAQSALKSQKTGTEKFIQWLAIAVRTLFLSGRADEARRLRSDLIGELKIACIELYQRQAYPLCLQYCEEYLQADPDDFEIALHRARSLSRLGRDKDALAVLENLLKLAPTTGRRVRLLFSIARTHLEAKRDEEAKKFYLQTLDLNPKYLPALEGMTEFLLKNNAVSDADGFVERAIAVAPMNAWALSAHADLLWRKGKAENAIGEMEKAVKSQPDNPTFLFRLGRFHQQSGQLTTAYDMFRRAKANDDTYLDARLSLASVAINLSKLDEAAAEIKAIRRIAPSEKKHVLDNIEAEYHLALGDIETAAQIAESALRHHRRIPALGVMAKIEAARAKTAKQNGMQVLAESHRSRAETLIREGLVIDPHNAPLLAQLNALD